MTAIQLREEVRALLADSDFGFGAAVALVQIEISVTITRATHIVAVIARYLSSAVFSEFEKAEIAAY